jgi:hypothetical protein
MSEILAPPEGLDPATIVTEAGLLTAIEREVAKLETARKERRRLDRDEIRLISFLAGEVRRRVASLTPDQQREFLEIREEAQYRELETRVQDMAGEVAAFVRVADTGKGEFRFSRISELEMAIRDLSTNFEADPERFSDLLSTLTDLTRRLRDVKNRGSLFGGLKSFG